MILKTATRIRLKQRSSNDSWLHRRRSVIFCWPYCKARRVILLIKKILLSNMIKLCFYCRQPIRYVRAKVKNGTMIIAVEPQASVDRGSIGAKYVDGYLTGHRITPKQPLGDGEERYVDHG